MTHGPRHAQPVFVLSREPRPADRETRMYPLPGKWATKLREDSHER